MSRNVIQEIIAAKYCEMNRKNPLYSRRSFSRHLGIGAGALSEILSGKREITQGMVLVILKTSLFTSDEKKRIVTAYLYLIHQKLASVICRVPKSGTDNSEEKIPSLTKLPTPKKMIERSQS